MTKPKSGMLTLYIQSGMLMFKQINLLPGTFYAI